MYSQTVKKLAAYAIRFPLLIFCLTGLLSLITGYFTLKLSVRSDFKALLPDSFESVVNITRVDDAYGGISHLYAVVQGPTESQTEHFIDRAVGKIEKIPTVSYVIGKLPASYFKKRLGLYINLEDLEEIDRRIRRSAANSKKGGSVIFSNMLDLVDPEDSASLDLSDIEKKYTKHFGSLWGSTTRIGGVSENQTPRDRGYFYGPEGKNYVVWIKSTTSFLDLDASQKLIATISQTLDTLNTNQFQGKMAYDFTGTYKTLLDQNKHLKRQILVVLLIVFFILGVITAAYYRNAICALVIAIPLGMALCWSGAVTYFLIGHINLISGFTGFMLLGLGSDYGIYLLDRYLSERETKSMDQALILSFLKTGRATMGAFLTTLAGFAALIHSQFKGFSEFGLIGVIGMTANFLAMMVVLPCLFVLMERYRLFSRGGITLNLSARFIRFDFLRPLLNKPLPVLLVSGGFLLFSLIVFPDKLTVDYHSDGIENQHMVGYRLEKVVKKIVGQPLKPPVVLVRSLNEEKEALRALTQLRDMPAARGLVKQVLSLGSFVPDFQDKKRVVVASILKHWKELKVPVSANIQEILSDFDNLSLIPDITREDLPFTIRKIFLPLKNDGEVFSALYLFPGSVHMGKKEDVERFTKIFKKIELPGGRHVAASSESFILADILYLIEKDGPWIIVRIFLFLFFILFIDFRSLKKVFAIFIPMVATIPFLVGWMALLGLKLNIINVCIIPVIFAVGIDGLIHYYHRYLEKSTALHKVSKDIVSSIFFATFTSLVGFGGFALVSIPYIRSLGLLAILGISMIFIVVVVVFPAWILLWHRGLGKPH